MSNLPVSQNLDAYRGDTFSQIFRLRSGGNPVNLAGATVASQAKPSSGGTNVGLVATVTDAANGEITLKLPSTQPEPGLYTYDIEVTLAGVVTTWVRGKLNISEDVTNEQP